MTQEELNKNLDSHELWLEDNKKSERANLARSDLTGATLTNAKLANHIVQSERGYLFAVD